MFKKYEGKPIDQAFILEIAVGIAIGVGITVLLIIFKII